MKRNESIDKKNEQFPEPLRLYAFFEKPGPAIVTSLVLHLLLMSSFLIPFDHLFFSSEQEPENEPKVVMKKLPSLRTERPATDSSSLPNKFSTSADESEVGSGNDPADDEKSSTGSKPNRTKRSEQKQSENESSDHKVSKQYSAPLKKQERSSGSGAENNSTSEKKEEAKQKLENSMEEAGVYAVRATDETSGEPGTNQQEEHEQKEKWKRRIKRAVKQNDTKEEPSSSSDETLEVDEKGKRAPTYWEGLSSFLGKYFSQPDVVRYQNLNETVILRVGVQRDGSIVLKDTLVYSDYPELNQVARNTIRRAGRYKSPPLGEKDDEWVLDVTFRFHQR